MTRVGYGLLFLTISVILFLIGLLGRTGEDEVVEVRSSPDVLLVSPIRDYLHRLKHEAEKSLLTRAILEDLKSSRYIAPNVIVVEYEKREELFRIFEVEIGVKPELSNGELRFGDLKVELRR